MKDIVKQSVQFIYADVTLHSTVLPYTVSLYGTGLPCTMTLYSTVFQLLVSFWPFIEKYLRQVHLS